MQSEVINIFTLDINDPRLWFTSGHSSDLGLCLFSATHKTASSLQKTIPVRYSLHVLDANRHVSFQVQAQVLDIMVGKIDVVILWANQGLAKVAGQGQYLEIRT
jgi:hypothetical protein